MTKLKLLLLIVFTTGIILLKNPIPATALLAFILIVSTVVGKKQKLKERILPLLTIGLFIILFQLFFNTSIVPGQRIKSGIVTAEKITALSLLVFLFTETASTSKIAAAFSFLPKKMKLMLTITFSLIPTVMDETKKITLVQSSRGQNFRGLNLYRIVIPVVIPLLHRTLKRAEQIAIVIESRGFRDE